MESYFPMTLGKKAFEHMSRNEEVGWFFFYPFNTLKTIKIVKKDFFFS